MKLILACVLFIGLVALLGYGFERMDEGKATTWPGVEGKLIEIEDRRVGMPIISRFMPVAIPYAKYSYSVSGKTYIGEKNCGPCLSWVRNATFHPPEIETADTSAILKDLEKDGHVPTFADAMKATQDLIESAHYKPIKVHYDVNHPEVSVPDPDVLQGGASLWWTSVLLIAVGGLGLGGLAYHAYITAPVENDPALSLDAALRAQQRRR